MDELQNRSLSELVGDLSRDTGTLVHKELQLARIELERMAAVAAQHLASVAVGAALCHAGLLTLTATLVLAGVWLGVPALAGAAVITVVWLGVGGFLAWRGVSRLRAASFVPQETLQTVKETAAWAREQVR